jgi:hypothetical protein
MQRPDSSDLIQVTAATVSEMRKQFRAVNLEPDQTDPYTSLCASMLYLRVCYDYLLPIFGAPLIYCHPCMAYNYGPGRIGRGETDWPYYYRWASCQPSYAALDLPMAAP